MTLTPAPRGTAGSVTPAGDFQIPDDWLHRNRADLVAAVLEAHDHATKGHTVLDDKQLLERWLKGCSRTQSAETRSTYGRHLERFRLFLRRHHGHSDHEQPNEFLLSGCDSKSFETFALGLRELTTQLKPNGKPVVAPATYNAVISAISAFFKWACEPNRRKDSGIYFTPVSSGLLIAKQPTKARALNRDELTTVFTSSKLKMTSKRRARSEVVLRMLLVTGCRATEFVNLRWDDLSTNEKGEMVLHVRAEVAKGSKERFIGLPPKFAELASQLQELQPESPWLIPSFDNPNRHISRQTLWEISKQAGKHVGIHAHPHLFRHSHATISYGKTKDPKRIQQTLGHSQVSTTLDLYVHSDPSDSSANDLMD